MTDHVACRMAQSPRSAEGVSAKFPRLHSFCIGLEGSPDLAAAQKVADYLGTVHHAYTFTVEQGVDAVSQVIAHLETFDVTTVRAATCVAHLPLLTCLYYMFTAPWAEGQWI